MRAGLLAPAVALAVAPALARAAPPPVDEGVLVGVSVSQLGPGFPHDSPGGEWSEPPSFTPGPAVGVIAGYRWDWFILGASYQHGFLGGGTWSVKTDAVRTFWAASDYVGLDLAAITAPRAILAAYFHLALGARAMRFATDDGSGGPASNGGYVDPDVMLGIGAQLRLSRVRAIPEAGIGMGPIGLYGQLGATVFFDFAPEP